MIIENLPQEFKKALPVINEIEEAGFEAYFVGGSVRDIMLNHQIHDVDIATSAFPEEIKHIFKKTIDIGIEHGTVLVLFEDEQYEITTFRTESTYQDYRRPDEVTFVRSLEEDLKRRDFTMNALAMNKNGEIVDLFNGIDAINKKEIVAVGDASERFNEDALRMMRGLRFSSQLNFTLEKETKKAIKEHRALLGKISIERIYIEWIKLLLGEYRNKGIAAFIETQCFNYCPGLENKKAELERFLELDESKTIKDEETAWLLLCYLLMIEDIPALLKQWKSSNKMIQSVKVGVHQLRKRKTSDWSVDDLYQTGSEVISFVEDARNILGKSHNKAIVLSRYEELPIKSIKDMHVNGKDIIPFLEEKPGPWLGDVLSELEEKVLHGIIVNNKEELLKEAKAIRKRVKEND
ncbi:MAG: CCA tRNA nucleotidyltransferase [Vagococcus sp.]|uniref:CCA tRNA nucleotidyltransferase n=1 Tax=Vagococcus sp. TaxID=1933889 RepID=UPI002FCBDDEF